MGFPINTRSILLALVSVALSFPTPFAFLHITTNSLSTRQTLGQGINSSSNPPYQMYSILSTPTTITFLLSDPNPAAPTPDGGPGTPVRCSASFADKDGNTDMSQIPYDPQPCVDVVTGNAESASLFGWQAIDYRGPGLFVVRVWHGYLDKKYVFLFFFPVLLVTQHWC
jgi:hypothetical protein